MSDFIGNVDGLDLMESQVNTLYQNFCSGSKLYPELADSILLTKDSGEWADYPTLKTEIIPVDTITKDFKIHFADIRDISANGGYTLKIYKGLAGFEVEIAVIGFFRNSVMSQEGSQIVRTCVIPANSRISAAISSSNSAQDTCLLKLQYVEL